MIDFVSLLSSATPEITNLVGKFIKVLYDAIGNFGWTVVVFTIIIKLVLSPLDIWQKVSSRKQSKAMARLQPQMAKLQKQYANKPDILKQKQMELYRKEKVGMFGMCLPMIATMAVFFVVLSGFNAMVRYQNEVIVFNIAQKYIEAQQSGTPLSIDQLAALYQPESWLWIKNIFMPDTWSSVIPTIEQYAGSGMGALNATTPDIAAAIPDWYNTLVGPAMELHNKTSFWNIANWNGYMVLPILSIITSLLSGKFMQASTANPMGTEAQQKQSQKTQKLMMYFMPLIFGIFSLFYSSAFALYIFISNLFSTIFGVSFNLITKAIDKKQEKEVNSTVIRR